MNLRNSFPIILIALIAAQATEPLAPGPVPLEVCTPFVMAPFSQKHMGVSGLPIVRLN